MSSALSIPELWMRFRCEACGHILRTPVHKIISGRYRCPHCGSDREFPSLDEQIEGVAFILRSQEKLPVDAVPCPNGCGNLRVSAGLIGRSRRCDKCHQRLTLRLTFEEETNAAEEPSPPPQQNGRGSGLFARFVGTRSATPPAEAEPAFSAEPHSPDEQAPIVYGQNGASSPAATMSRARPFGSMRAGYRTIYWTNQLVIPWFLALAANSLHSMLLIAVFLVFVIPRSCRRISEFVASLVLGSFRCPGCHQDHEAVSRWQCGCGYVDHRERHILTMRCPLCKGRIGHVNCRYCDATIFVR